MNIGRNLYFLFDDQLLKIRPFALKSLFLVIRQIYVFDLNDNEFSFVIYSSYNLAHDIDCL